MKTVLMICPFAKPNVGGVENHLEKLMSYVSKREYQATLIAYQPLTTQARGARYEKKDNREIFRVSWFGRGWFPKLESYFPLVFIYLFPGLFLKSLFLYIRRNRRIDVIHAHGLIAAVIVRILAKVAPKRVVVSTHAIYNLRHRRLLALLVKWLLQGFDALLAVGEPSRQELIDIGLDERKIKVHPNWIDINVFRPLNRAECRADLNLKSTDFVVLFLGRLIEIKGILILLDVAKKTNKDMKFIFVGDGPLSKTIQDEAKTNDKISYYGRLGDDETIKTYNAADVFVSPVLYEEGFGAVYLESIACGTPVISANRGCLPHFLTPEVAVLLETINAESVLKRLEFYFENRSILEDKRKLCRRYAERCFSEKNAKVILNSY